MDQKRRGKSLKTVDLEVQLSKTKGVETTISEQRSEIIPLETLHHRASVVRQEPRTCRDISSGYSSTDRSSEHGSLEQLIPTGIRRV